MEYLIVLSPRSPRKQAEDVDQLMTPRSARDSGSLPWQQSLLQSTTESDSSVSSDTSSFEKLNTSNNLNITGNSISDVNTQALIQMHSTQHGQILTDNGTTQKFPLTDRPVTIMYSKLSDGTPIGDNIKPISSCDSCGLTLIVNCADMNMTTAADGNTAENTDINTSLPTAVANANTTKKRVVTENLQPLTVHDYTTISTTVPQSPYQPGTQHGWNKETKSTSKYAPETPNHVAIPSNIATTLQTLPAQQNSSIAFPPNPRQQVQASVNIAAVTDSSKVQPSPVQPSSMIGAQRMVKTGHVKSEVTRIEDLPSSAFSPPKSADKFMITMIPKSDNRDFQLPESEDMNGKAPGNNRYQQPLSANNMPQGLLNGKSSFQNPSTAGNTFNSLPKDQSSSEGIPNSSGFQNLPPGTNTPQNLLTKNNNFQVLSKENSAFQGPTVGRSAFYDPRVERNQMPTDNQTLPSNSTTGFRKLELDPEAVHRFFQMYPSFEEEYKAFKTTEGNRNTFSDFTKVGTSSSDQFQQSASAFQGQGRINLHVPRLDLSYTTDSTSEQDMDSFEARREAPHRNLLDAQTPEGSSIDTTERDFDRRLQEMLTSDVNTRPLQGLKLQIPTVSQEGNSWENMAPVNKSNGPSSNTQTSNQPMNRVQDTHQDLRHINGAVSERSRLSVQNNSLAPTSPVIITLERASPAFGNSNITRDPTVETLNMLNYRRHSINTVTADTRSYSPRSPTLSSTSSTSSHSRNCSPMCMRRNSIGTDHPANVNLLEKKLPIKPSPQTRTRRNSIGSIHQANISPTEERFNKSLYAQQKNKLADRLKNTLLSSGPKSPMLSNNSPLSPRADKLQKSNPFSNLTSPTSPSGNIKAQLQTIMRNRLLASEQANNTLSPRSPVSPQGNNLQNIDSRLLSPVSSRGNPFTANTVQQVPGKSMGALVEPAVVKTLSPASPPGNLANTTRVVPNPGSLLVNNTTLPSPSGSCMANACGRPTALIPMGQNETEYSAYGPSGTGSWDWTTPRSLKGVLPAEATATGQLSPTAEVGQEADALHQKSLAMQEQSLGPLKEDLAEWIGRTLGIDISADTFMDVLDNGVYLCNIANIIHKKAIECVQQGTSQDVLPDIKLRSNKKAKSGSWFARDNTANYTVWCKAFGFRDDCTFESEDLVSHKNERQVIISLLELARLGYKYGLEPPSLIKMETEMDKEQPEPFEEPPPPKPVIIEEKKKKPPPQSARTRPLNLDDEVKKMAAKCKCLEHVKRLREGTYMVFGKVVIVRLLKNRHLMVRVGGGWDTLEHYLIHHNPLFITEHRRNSSFDFLDGDDVVSNAMREAAVSLI